LNVKVADLESRVFKSL